MSAQPNFQNEAPPASRWRLWVDGCGGFLLIDGSSWTVGGFDQRTPADICVRADWPRRAGTIIRKAADYFWQPWQSEGTTSTKTEAIKPQLIKPQSPLPIAGSAEMTLSCPSPLCNSATLNLRDPHRFEGHVDGVVLADHLLLMGPTPDCHIRTSDFPEQIILMGRENQWHAKPKNENSLHPLPVGERVSIGTLAMTLERA